MTDATNDLIITALGQLKSGLDRLEARFDGLEARFDRLEASVGSLRANLMDRLDRQQETLSGVREDIIVSIGRAAHAETVAKNVREELEDAAKETTTLYRMVKRLETRVERLEGSGG